jgi:hypothetical protein
MADINQATTADSAHFWAGSQKGDDWMRLHYENAEITFSLPADAELAAALIKMAAGAGLTIANL